MLDDLDDLDAGDSTDFLTFWIIVTEWFMMSETSVPAQHRLNAAYEAGSANAQPNAVEFTGNV